MSHRPPTDREWERVLVPNGHGPSSDPRKAVEEGKVVTAPKDYDIPYLWKDDDGTYQGFLVHFGDDMESLTFPDLDAALDWFRHRVMEDLG